MRIKLQNGSLLYLPNQGRVVQSTGIWTKNSLHFHYAVTTLVVRVEHKRLFRRKVVLLYFDSQYPVKNYDNVFYPNDADYSDMLANFESLRSFFVYFSEDIEIMNLGVVYTLQLTAHGKFYSNIRLKLSNFHRLQ